MTGERGERRRVGSPGSRGWGEGAASLAVLYFGVSQLRQVGASEGGRQGEGRQRQRGGVGIGRGGERGRGEAEGGVETDRRVSVDGGMQAGSRVGQKSGRDRGWVAGGQGVTLSSIFVLPVSTCPSTQTTAARSTSVVRRFSASSRNF